MGSLNIGESIHLNSFVGHHFVVKSDKKVILYLIFFHFIIIFYLIIFYLLDS